MSDRDPLLSRLEEQMLAMASRQAGNDGQPGEPAGRFRRYYEVDIGGKVERAHEEYAFSDEDDLHGRAYCVVGDALWEYSITDDGDAPPALRVRAVHVELRPARAPRRVIP